MAIDTTPRGYRVPDGSEPPAIDVIVGRLADDIDSDVGTVARRVFPMLSYILPAQSSAFGAAAWSQLVGTPNIPTSRVRVTLSGVVNSTVANDVYNIELRTGSAAGAAIARLRARPSAAGGVGQESRTCTVQVDVAAGVQPLYLVGTRASGTGDGSLLAGFLVEVEAVTV